MQIHELNRPRRTDEGLLGAIGTALGQAVSPGVGTTQDFRASSAGILDPEQKLAAVMKNSQMADQAAKYADAWLTDKRSQVSAAPATTVKEAEATATAPGTYNKKTGAAKLGGKTMTALSDLPPAMQQQILAKQQATAPTASAPTAPPTGKATAPTAPGFTYNNVMKMPGMEKYAKPATPAATPNFAGPAGYKTTNATVNGAPAVTQPTMPGTAPTGQPKPAGPADAGAGAMNAMAGQLARGGAAEPNTMANAPVSKTNKAKPGNPNTGQAQPATGSQTPADPYIKNFLEFANEKIAMRDSATYKMLGLTDAEGSELGPQLDAAKEKVKAAQGNPAATKTAVKNYILIAMAALQLVASQNAVKAASPEAPAYGQQPTPAGQAGKTGQSGAADSTAGTAPATGQLAGSNAVALLTQSGLTPQILTIAGQKIQKSTGNKQLSKTGDSVIDTMLEGMGYTVA
jgi:hypothetical protein